ncbi:MAG: ATP-binding protein [Betaproteobacteria bacterium]|nr:ATP-binding protein [Betaproteobacteria bacterium]
MNTISLKKYFNTAYTGLLALLLTLVFPALGYWLAIPIGAVLDIFDVLKETPAWTWTSILPIVLLAVVPALMSIVQFPHDRLPGQEFIWSMAVIWASGFLLYRHQNVVYAYPVLAAAGLLCGVYLYCRMTTPLRDSERPPESLWPSGEGRTDQILTQPVAAPSSSRSEAKSSAPPAFRFVAKRARYNRHHTAGMVDTIATMEAAVGQALWGAEGTPARPRRNANTKNGLLLAGRPGNGKTFLAEVMAGIHQVPFLAVSAADLVSMWVGETTQNVARVFEEARAQAPCVLLLDEFDSFMMPRQSVANADSESVRTANTLLTKLVDIRGSGVCVIAATNFPDKLDRAGIREGRFDFKITVPDPDLAARVGLLRTCLKQAKVTLSSQKLERMAKRWEGFSVKRILSIGEAVADNNRGCEIFPGDLLKALRKVQGFGGSPLPEGTPGFSELYYDPETRERFRSLAVRMNDMAAIEEVGGAVPSGILLHGAPGTGKSAAARALAKDTGWAFVHTTGQDLLADGEIDRVIDKALDLRPALIFIDEADDILLSREHSPFARSATNKLLARMDGAAGRLHDVVFIAATNHPEHLDAAMLRGGRFADKIELRLPDATTLERYLHHWMANPERKLSFTENFTPAATARMLAGLSFATVDSVLKQAIAHAYGRNPNPVRLSLADVAMALKEMA